MAEFNLDELFAGSGRPVEDYIKLLDTLEKHIKQLGTTIGSAEKDFQDVAKRIFEMNAPTKENQQELSKLLKTYREQQKATKELEKAKRDLAKAQEKLGKVDREEIATKLRVSEARRRARMELKDEEILASRTAGEYEKKNARLRQLTRQYKGLTAEQRQNKSATGQLISEIRGLQKELKDADAAIGNFQRNVGDYTNSIRSALANGLSGAASAGGGGLGAIAGGLQGASASLPQVAVVAAVVSGLNEAIQTFDRMNDSMRQVQSVSGLVGDGLANVSAKALSISNSFNTDFNEVLRTANAISKQFGVSLAEALDQINAGFVQNADISGQYLDSLYEYSQVFVGINVSLEDFNNLNIAAARAGVWQDKAVDAIKEINLRLGDLTPSQKAIIDGMGDIGQEIQQAFASGDQIGAIQMLVGEINRLEDAGQNVTPIISNLGGGPLEDLGRVGREVVATFQDYNRELTESEQRILKTQQVQEAYNAELNKLAQNFAGVGNAVSNFFISALTEAAALVNEIIGSFDTLEEKLGKTKDAAKGFSDDELRSELEKTNKAIIEQQKEVDKAAEKLAKYLEAGGNDQHTLHQFQKEEIENLKELRLLREQSATLAEEYNMRIQQRSDEATAAAKAQAEAEKQQAAQSTIAAKAAADRTAQELELYKTRNELIKERLSLEKQLLEQLKLQDGQQQPRVIAQLRSEISKLNAEIGKTVQGLDKMGVNISDIEKNVQGIAPPDPSENTALLSEQYVQIRRQERRLTEQQENRAEVTEYVAGQAISFGQQYLQMRQQQLEQERSSLEIQKQYELSLVGDNADAKIEIEQKFAQRDLQIRRKQANASKLQAAFDIAVNTASAIVQALPNIPLSVVIGGIGAIQLAAVAAQPVPKFKDGQFKLDLPNGAQDGVDTIPALYRGVQPVMLDKHETILPRAATYKFPNLLQGILAGHSSEKLYEAFAKDTSYREKERLSKSDKQERRAVIKDILQRAQHSEKEITLPEEVSASMPNLVSAISSRYDREKIQQAIENDRHLIKKDKLQEFQQERQRAIAKQNQRQIAKEIILQVDNSHQDKSRETNRADNTYTGITRNTIDNIRSVNSYNPAESNLITDNSYSLVQNAMSGALVRGLQGSVQHSTKLIVQGGQQDNSGLLKGIAAAAASGVRQGVREQKQIIYDITDRKLLRYTKTRNSRMQIAGEMNSL